jgi:hypothetical protein
MSGEQRTLVIDREAWFMRFVRWSWDLRDEDELSFCVLFWLLLFSPYGAYGKIVFRAVAFGARRSGRALRTAALTAHAADRVAAGARAYQKGIEVSVAVISIACMLSCLGLLAYIAYTAAWWALLIPGSVACLGVALWAARDTRLMRVLSAGYHATKTRTCPRVEFSDSDRKASTPSERRSPR